MNNLILGTKVLHQTVAKTLRYSNYKAKCVFNGLMEQPYEVVVKGISREEANELQQRFCDIFKDSRINIING
jgi:hypothetical protein